MKKWETYWKKCYTIFLIFCVELINNWEYESKIIQAQNSQSQISLLFIEEEKKNAEINECRRSWLRKRRRKTVLHLPESNFKTIIKPDNMFEASSLSLKVDFLIFFFFCTAYSPLFLELRLIRFVCSMPLIVLRACVWVCVRVFFFIQYSVSSICFVNIRIDWIELNCVCYTVHRNFQCTWLNWLLLLYRITKNPIFWIGLYKIRYLFE